MILKNSKNTKVNHIPISKITQTSLYTLLQIPKEGCIKLSRNVHPAY